MLGVAGLARLLLVSRTLRVAAQAAVLTEIASRRAATLAAASRCKQALTADEGRRVDAALSAPSLMVVVESFNTTIMGEHTSRLAPGGWLGDELVNYYFAMLQDRDDRLCEMDNSPSECHFANSFFMGKLMGGVGGSDFAGVERWTRGVDIFSCRLVLVPINVDNVHWCLLVVELASKRIRYYDSMGGSGGNYLAAMHEYLCDEHMAKKGAPLDGGAWQLVHTTDDTPRQTNGFDCGVFATFCAHYLAHGVRPNSPQGGVLHSGRSMMIGILNKRLV